MELTQKPTGRNPDIDNEETSQTNETPWTKKESDFAIENKDLVYSIISKLHGFCEASTLEPDDLKTEGFLLLIKALRKFDGSKTGKFSTYAYPVIFNGLVRHIRECGFTIRIPEHMHDKLHKMHEAESSFISTNGRNPTESELAEIAGEAEQNISARQSYRDNMTLVSMQDLVDPNRSDTEGEEITSYRDPVKADHNPEHDLIGDLPVPLTTFEVMQKLYKLFPKKEADLMCLYHGLEFTIPKIAEKYGMSYSATKNSITRNTKKFRKILETESTD